jgi:RNA polymerase sigma-70 factor (ECF subfamily)
MRKSSGTENGTETMVSTAVSTGTMEARDRAQTFERLIRDSHRQAYSLAYRLTGNSSEAEDLVQEAYVRAFRFFDRYDKSLPFQSWLYRIISNTHIDLIRRKGRLKTSSLDGAGADGTQTWEVADSTPNVEQRIQEATMDAPVQSALNEMNSDFRTAVILADVEGLAYEEVAEIMNTSVGTVRSRIHRGRKQLRDHLMKNAPDMFRRFTNDL